MRSLAAILVGIVVTSAAAPAPAADPAADPAAGEALFRRCVACHRVASAERELVPGGTIGPNLYGVVGGLVGGLEGYRYGDGLAALAARGLRWDEPSLAAYIANPNAFLAERLGADAPPSRMPFALGEGAADVAAYLSSLGR